ncbi:MAG: hypothetical protein KIT31_21420, partial [Deltaproteobacteria bacterium]|nr:hypothetical protein [Deltaproteobacteria bacterium]
QRIGDTPLGLTLDGEVARGPAVRSGLGLRSLDDGRRITVAPGLAGGIDMHVATARAHVRYLHAVETAQGAFEVGAGASTRINWARDFWGGTWPLEMWLDYRYRRGLDGGPAREHEVRGGLDYTPKKWLDRVGVQLAGTGDRTGDGRRVHGLALIVGIEYGGGDRDR